MPSEEERVGLLRQWLGRAEEDVRGADLMQQSGLLGLATYHCRQAVEKSFKGFLSLHDRPFRRTHNLSELLHQCAELDGAFRTLTGAAELVSPYLTEFRYPRDIAAPTFEQAQAAIGAARDVVAFVQSRTPPAPTT